MPSPEESPPRRRAELPATIGRYRIIDRVGSGAMGVVYSAYDNAMGRPVAIKVLMGDLESDPAVRARFYREARAAAGLLHPNIIIIYDAGEDQGRSFIAMQLLEGWPLATYMKRPEAASIERKLDLMIQMCEGLAVAHSHGIVHRDLKPGNLFVQSDGLLKILDFGIARIANSNMTVTGSMLGTPDYMSPEQARGTQIDARSDIFSTGAVFYFMLAGHKPFPGPDVAAVLHQLQVDDPAPLSEAAAPPNLSRLIMQAMAKSPGDRPARIQDLLASILRFRRHFQADSRRLSDEAVARERRRRSLLLQQVLDRAAEAIADGRVDEAEAVLREAEPIDPTNAAIRDLRAELAEARLAAAEAERLRQQAADEIRRARGVFRRGRYDEAVMRLQAWAATHPVTDVIAEAERLAALRDRITRSEQLRRRQVIELMDAARTLAESGVLEEALSRAGDAVRCDPSDLEASSLLNALLERDRVARFDREQARARDERRRHVEPMLEAARDTYARGYLSSALAIALAASQIDPDTSEIAQLIEELRAAVTIDDRETFDLEDEPFPGVGPCEPPASPQPPPPGSRPSSLDRSQDGGVLSQMNQWLLRRRPTSR